MSFKYIFRIKIHDTMSSHHGSVETNLTSIHEDAGSILSHAQWVKTWHCRDLWCRLQMCLGTGVAMAIVQVSSYGSNSTPLVWEPPYALSATLKGEKINHNNKNRGQVNTCKLCKDAIISNRNNVNLIVVNQRHQVDISRVSTKQNSKLMYN